VGTMTIGQAAHVFQRYIEEPSIGEPSLGIPIPANSTLAYSGTKPPSGFAAGLSRPHGVIRTNTRSAFAIASPASIRGS
jgi:hypothetical protein